MFESDLEQFSKLGLKKGDAITRGGGGNLGFSAL